jgi:hypothetical protein
VPYKISENIICQMKTSSLARLSAGKNTPPPHRRESKTDDTHEMLRKSLDGSNLRANASTKRNICGVGSRFTVRPAATTKTMDAGTFVSGMLVLHVSSVFPKVGIIPF